MQVGAFNHFANAQRTAASLRTQGFPAGIAAESTGRQAVRVGPVATYLEAKGYRSRLLSAFPAAVIEP